MPQLLYVKIAIAAAVAIFLAYSVHNYGAVRYDEGFAFAKSTYEAAILKEQTRQKAENAKALAAAIERERAYQQELSELNDKMEAMSHEADKDPRAGADSLSADSVHRIDSAR